jgi:hypothetical protein
MNEDADGAVNVLDMVARRRRWFDHWYRPGTDTPLGYFAGRFAFLALLVVGAPSAVIGHGWHPEPGVWLVVLVDGSWHARNLWRKLRLHP